MKEQIKDKEFRIYCCINRKGDGTLKHCCASKGSERFPEYIKTRCKDLNLNNTEIIASKCLAHCRLGKTLFIEPDNVYYHYENEKDIDLILSNHIKERKIVEHLKLDKNKS